MSNELKMYNQFAISISPKVNESFSGYVLRASAENGIQTWMELAQLVEFKLSKSSFDIGSESYLHFTHVLAEVNTLPAQELIESFDAPLLAIDKGRAIKDIRLPSPKVCIECMKQPESAYIKSDWELAHHTHCETHSVKLTHSCPCCGDELRWVSDVFEGCPSCGARWEEMSSAVTPIPLFQSVCDTLDDLELKVYLRALYQSFIYAGRPHDLMFNEFNEMPSHVSSHLELFEQAYHLISNHQAVQSWVARRAERLTQISHLNNCSQSVLEYLAAIANAPQVDFLPKLENVSNENLYEQAALISPIRKSFEDCGRESLREHITLTTAAIILGVTTKVINAFIEVGLLESCDGIIRSSNRHVSAKSISNLIAKVTDRAEPMIQIEDNKDLISIKRLSKGLTYFNCELSSLLIRLKNTKCKVYFDECKDFSIWDLYVNRAEVINILEFHFTESIIFQGSKTKLRDICNLTSNQFLKLSNEFDFQETKYCPTFANINAPQIGDFFNKYVLLNRWAKMSDVQLTKVIKFLGCEAGLKRYPNLDEDGIYIFEQSEQLSNSLTRFLLFHRGEYQLLAKICA